MKNVRRVRQIRVLLMGMPRLMSDMIRAIISSDENMSVVGEVRPDGGILRAVSSARADVMIIGDADGSSDDCYEVLYRRPHLKIVSISADGRDGSLYELSPRVESIADISADGLITAIRSATSMAAKPVT